MAKVKKTFIYGYLQNEMKTLNLFQIINKIKFKKIQPYNAGVYLIFLNTFYIILKYALSYLFIFWHLLTNMYRLQLHYSYSTQICSM